MKPNLINQIAIQSNQAQLFLLADEKGYDMPTFITIFMKSPLAKAIDSSYSSWQMMPAIKWLEEIEDSYKEELKIKPKTKYPKEAIAWLGYFYRRWHFLTDESSVSILHFLKPSDGLLDYYAMHTIDESNAIEIFKSRYNQKRNNHRLYELKQQDLPYFENADNYSELAKHVLYKLSHNPSFKKMPILYEDAYTFLDTDNQIGLMCETLFKGDCHNIYEIYKRNDENIAMLGNRPPISIFFMFVFSYRYVNIPIEDFVLEIKSLVKEYHINKRHFDYLYFYISGTLIEVNQANEIKKYYVPISNKKANAIIKKAKVNN